MCQVSQTYQFPWESTSPFVIRESSIISQQHYQIETLPELQLLLLVLWRLSREREREREGCTQDHKRLIYSQISS